MKKLSVFLITLIFLTSNTIKAQENAGAAAAAGALVGAIAAIAAIDQIEESLELIAVERVLEAYPFLTNFELKSATLKGTKAKDLSSVRVVSFNITDLDTKERYVLFAFTSYGWANEYGVDFSRILWKNFRRNEWNNLMQKYIETASGEKVSLQDIAESKIVNSGVKQGGLKYIVKFDKLKGDVYQTSDYSDEFKIVFNEKSLGLYLKATSNLIQIARSTIIETHEHLNSEE